MSCELLSREFLLVVTLSCFSLLDPHSRSGGHSQLKDPRLKDSQLKDPQLKDPQLKTYNS
jgi:hypothetical protein